ncbi:MAG TPA: DUF5663 domain-containing protein [Candidatus Saccharimonadales bacterium]|nr:DUF5663 domain-containing protein [Candidatus Saccharimonadales bacterium]
MSKDDQSTMQPEDRLLAAMGLKGLESDEKAAALQDILFTLNTRVGRRMIEGFSPEQAEEFERLSRPGTDVEKLMYWISLNVPNHQQMIEEETRKMRDDATNFADEMMQKAGPAPQESKQ